MQLSLNLFGLPVEDYGTISMAAERAGYELIWLSDHLVTPVEWEPTYPYSGTGRPGAYSSRTPLADVWSMLGYLAAATSRIGLATGVYILPLRNPFVTARAASTVQLLSGGRLTLGVGSGWLREEFEAVGERFDDRGGRMDEIVDILRKLWSGEPVAHDGAHYRFAAVQMAPPLQPQPAIVVGGLTPPALRRAARVGDGWFGPHCTLDEAVAAREAIESERRRAGRDHLPFTYYVRVADPWGPAEWDALQQAGFEHVSVFPGQLVPGAAGDVAAVIEGIERLAESAVGV
ncbi:MAG TPA: TIGR03619 family F420-dependent LLM class oxidoreductase [Candidatus Dormibacteraeota bacterium]|jgi:probable F420-dependent oxidoreductase|nr:TIGR03619 family F420-dependent LLM class oxidoreductase [Candidatus Dormibacteraeota bacterium]